MIKYDLEFVNTSVHFNIFTLSKWKFKRKKRRPFIEYEMRITRSEWLNAIQKYKETIYTQILGEDRGEKMWKV